MATETKSTELDRVKFTNQDLAGITDFASVGALLASAELGVEAAEDYGTGFKILPTKQLLLLVPFIIIDWHYTAGDNGEFVSMLVVTKTPITLDGEPVSKLIVNDGSTGIRDQLHMIDGQQAERGLNPQTPVMVKNGLRVSRYDYTDDKGNTTKAETYYLFM